MPRCSASSLRSAYGAFFIIAGCAHFIIPSLYLRIMPEWVPYPLPAIYFTGVWEVLGGAFLMRGDLQYARWLLVSLLIAVFPANVQMLTDHQEHPSIPYWILAVRLPLQAVLIFLVIATTKARKT